MDVPIDLITGSESQIISCAMNNSLPSAVKNHILHK